MQDWQQAMLNEELANGIMRMGTLAAFLLDNEVSELQENAFHAGVETHRTELLTYIKNRREQLRTSEYSNTEFGHGMRSVLADINNAFNHEEVLLMQEGDKK